MIRVRYTSRTTLFFERLKVRKERGKRDAIYSVSGLIARSAKQSLRIRPGSSRPGAIPMLTQGVDYELSCLLWIGTGQS
jgi:hypothetical protein